jgi:hypothetical protein
MTRELLDVDVLPGPIASFLILSILFILVRQAKFGTTCELKGAYHVNCLFDM